jgi:murein DD-endopeptidase MepM/ murein hydrolase activator NlpD
MDLLNETQRIPGEQVPRLNKRRNGIAGRNRSGPKDCLTSLMSRGREKYTVMVVPHDGKRTLSFHLSVFTALFLGLLFFALLVGFFWFFLDLSGHGARLTASRRELSEIEANLDTVRDEVNDFLTASKPFLASLSAATGIFGPEKESRDGLDGNLLSLFSSGSGNGVAEASELRDFRTALDRSTFFLDDLGATLSSQRELMESVPSIWPLQGVYGRITKNFGVASNPFHGRLYIHRGVDIGFGYGAPIVATADGIVVKNDYAGSSFGNYVDIRHKFGFTTRYAHLQRSLVKVGQQVSQGERIGLMGGTGNTTGVHLHYEVMLGDELVDPMKFLNIETETSPLLVPALRREFRD